MNLPAGNWDTEFVDNPESFDADRNTRGHLGFGYGVHQCIGANLARVEMQVAFATLARRLPGLTLAVPRAAEVQGRQHLWHEGAAGELVTTAAPHITIAERRVVGAESHDFTQQVDVGQRKPQQLNAAPTPSGGGVERRQPNGSTPAGLSLAADWCA